jgi:hypothetical protein
MSAYHPPTEDLAIFDPSVFNFNETPLTIGEASNYFLRYPQAQGEEDLQAINVLGTATFDDDIILNKNPTANITAPNNISMTSNTGNIDFNTTIAGTGVGFNTGIVNLVCDRLVNTGSYNQGVQNNITANPTTINFDVGCMICSTAGNDIQTLPYTQYSNGFIFSAVNLTAGVINLISQDINIYSWLRGNVATIYPIQPNSSITCELLPDFLTLGASIWFVRDDFGYKTINSTQNSIHYLNFSDASATGVGNIQKTSGIECNPNTKTITATTFSGSATGVKVEDNNSNLMYPVMIQGTAGDNKALYADITTSPFSYSASTGTLTTPQLNCTSLNSTGTSPTCNLWNTIVSSNVNMMNLFTTGNIDFARSLTTGTINIATNAQTTGNINIGSATSTTGAVVINCDLICNKTITAPSFSASSITTVSDNTNTTCYIPFSKTTAGANTELYLDDITGPLTYNPVSGAIGTTIVNCNRYDATGTTSAGTVFNNVGSGNTTYSNSCTTGSVSIASLAQTTGSVNIGSTTATTGVCSIRPPLVLSRQLRTTNDIGYSPSNDLDLGKTFTYFGSNFANTSLTGGVVLNVLSESFSSGRFGTYLITANVIINPNNTGTVKKCQISISTALGTIQTPYFVQTYSAIGGNVDTLFITRVVSIYTSTTITLTALCDGNATISNGVSDNLLTFTRIA